MTFTRPDGTGNTVDYSAMEVRPSIFLVSWNVTRNVAFKDGRVLNVKGTIQRVHDDSRR